MSGQNIAHVAGVVVTFNRLPQLKVTIEKSIETGLGLLVIVNNASTDGTKEWLDALDNSCVFIIHLDKNVGGAGGFNIGFDYVVHKTEMEWLVCYDDDAYPDEGSLMVFSSLDLPEDVAGVAASVYLPDGRISEMNRPSRDPFATFGSFISTLFKRRSGFHVSDETYASQGIIQIDFSSFVGCFLRTSSIRSRLGLPRKELFIYADDIMYTHGIGQCGMKHCFAPAVKFIHDCGTLVGQKAVYKPLWKVYYTYRNGLELYRQVAGPWMFYPIALYKLLIWIVNARFYDDRLVYLQLVMKAFHDGIVRDFSIDHDKVVALTDTK